MDIEYSRAAGAAALLPALCFVTWLIWFFVARAREGGARAARRIEAKLARSGGDDDGGGGGADA